MQKAIALILEAIYEADFLDCSYGFRPGRNCHQSLDVVDKTVMRNPINHVIDADIKGFLDKASWYSFQEPTWETEPSISCRNCRNVSGLSGKR